MKRIARLATAQRDLASAYHLRLVQNAAWLDIAKYALASAGFVLSAGLIVVASGAALRIGPARHAEGSTIPSVRPWLETDSAGTQSEIAAQGPDDVPMLIAKDPGQEVWARLISGEDLPKPDVMLAKPGNLVFRQMKIPSLTLKAITAQEWPTDLFAAPSVFIGPLLARTAPDDRTGSAARGESDPQAVVVPQGNDKSAAVPTKSGTSTTTPSTTTKTPTSSQPPSTQTPPNLPSVFVPPPPQGRPPSNPPGQDPPPTPPDQGGSGPVSPVPEPSGWACLLMGFGVIGTALRRGRPRPVPAPRSAISLPAA